MTFLLSITLATSLALSAITPLNQSQLTRLETADDNSTTFDEAAFYALLENASTWADTSGSQILIPDYTAIQNNPKEYRGKLCLVKGNLVSYWRLPRIAHSSWQHVKGLTIEYEPEKYIIVVLTDPPDLTPSGKTQQKLTPVDEYGYNVTLHARFFKLINRENRLGQTKPYMFFVGQSVSDLSPPPEAQDPNLNNDQSRSNFRGRGWRHFRGWGHFRGWFSFGGGLPFLLIAIFIIVYVLLRLTLLRTPPKGQTRNLNPLRTSRGVGGKTSVPGSRGAPGSGGIDITENNAKNDLSDDPAEALDEMNRQKKG